MKQRKLSIIWFNKKIMLKLRLLLILAIKIAKLTHIKKENLMEY